MTEVNPPLFLQTGCHDAASLRQWIAQSAGEVPGVKSPGDLAVSAAGARNLTIAGGEAYVADSEGGMYLVQNAGNDTVTVDAGDPANPRKDLIIARVLDSEYGTVVGGDRYENQVVKGTPSASPVAPALPPQSLLLAEVLVGAGATSISQGNITDKRSFARTMYSIYVRTTDPDNALGQDNDIWVKVV